MEGFLPFSSLLFLVLSCSSLSLSPVFSVRVVMMVVVVFFFFYFSFGIRRSIERIAVRVLGGSGTS